jgi:hypothetical protein
MTTTAAISRHESIGLLYGLMEPDVDLADWVPPSVRWRVRYTAHRTNGLSCRAWAVRGAAVCVVHGGAARQVRQAAQRRLAIATWEKACVRALRQLAAWQEQGRA